jgi:hypothetical protein
MMAGTHFVLNGRDGEEKEEKFKILELQNVFEGRRRTHSRSVLGPYISRGKVGLHREFISLQLLILSKVVS